MNWLTQGDTAGCGRSQTEIPTPSTTQHQKETKFSHQNFSYTLRIWLGFPSSLSTLGCFCIQSLRFTRRDGFDGRIFVYLRAWPLKSLKLDHSQLNSLCLNFFTMKKKKKKKSYPPFVILNFPNPCFTNCTNWPLHSFAKSHKNQSKCFILSAHPRYHWDPVP